MRFNHKIGDAFMATFNPTKKLRLYDSNSDSPPANCFQTFSSQYEPFNTTNWLIKCLTNKYIHHSKVIENSNPN